MVWDAAQYITGPKEGEAACRAVLDGSMTE